MKKLSPEFYAKLLDMYMKRQFVPSAVGFVFSGTTVGRPHFYWDEIAEHYPDLMCSNPALTMAIPELKEFCDSLKDIEESPLMKALS